MLARQSDDGVQFVHCAVCGHPHRKFGHPRPIAQRGFTGITGLGIDLVQYDHDQPPLTQTNKRMRTTAINCAPIRQRIALFAYFLLNSPPLAKLPMPKSRIPTTASMTTAMTMKSGSWAMVPPWLWR